MKKDLTIDDIINQVQEEEQNNNNIEEVIDNNYINRSRYADIVTYTEV